MNNNILTLEVAKQRLSTQRALLFFCNKFILIVDRRVYFQPRFPENKKNCPNLIAFHFEQIAGSFLVRRKYNVAKF